MMWPLHPLRAAAAAHVREMRIAFRNPITDIVPLEPAPQRAIPADADPAAFDADRAFATIEWQCAQGFRIPGTAAHTATRDMICRVLAESGGLVATQTWEQRVDRGPGAGRTFTMTNVFALFGPSVPRRPSEYIFGAHWDTRPVADRDPDRDRRTMPVPGANDGASGVAVLLEIARIWAAEPPRRPVVLAFFDGEDLGEYCYGSRFYGRTAQAGKAAGWNARAAIVIDMIGKSGLRCCTELHSLRNAPDLWAHVHRTASKLGLERHFGGPEGEIHDDHVFLQTAGIPSILLLDPRYPEWHTSGDLPETCNPLSLKVIGSILMDLAQYPAP